MEVKTHRLADKELLGEVVEVKEGFAKVMLKTCERMIVDDKGLVHGGFTFGAADLAAMIAVNHPNVVLYKAEVRFTAPVKKGETVFAEGRVVERNDRRIKVEAKAYTDKVVLEGFMYCYIPEKHVLED